MANAATLPTPAAEFDALTLRQVLGTYATGVAVMTTLDEDGGRHGLTVNSFASVSLEPPLVLWSQNLHAPSHAVFRRASAFAVNILANDQTEVSRRFASPLPDKFAGMALRAGLHGLPLIEGCAAYLECELEDRLPGGDHCIFIGRVRRIGTGGLPPLVFAGGRYHQLQAQGA